MTKNSVVRLASAGALLLACYAPVMVGLVRQWATDDDMSHGFFVIPVAAFVVWRRRGELAEIEMRAHWWGLTIVIFGAMQMLIGALAAQLFVERTALLVSLIGAVWFLGGGRALAILAFPLALLLFLFPIPAIVYARVTLPLQLFASAAAETVLNAVGIPVVRDGNILELPHDRLSVVEACSGIRSLLSLGFVSLVYGYFFDSRPAMRWVLLVATVPIAIAANAARVALTGIFSEYRGELAHGVAHTFESWTLFAAALALVIMLHQCLRRFNRATA